MRLPAVYLLIAAIAASAEASAQPAGVKLKDGAWVTADGRQLHTTRPGTAQGCRFGEPCNDGWSALVAAGEVARKSEWSSLPDAGSKTGWTWAYRGARLYFGGNLSVELAPAVAATSRAFAIDKNAVDHAAMKKLSARRWVAPDYLGEPTAPVYYAASLRAEETGTVELVYCVDSDGSPLYPEITKSAGFLRLDEATVRWIMRTRFKPGKLDGRAVTVCNVPMQFTWKLRPRDPPSINR